jgi:arylsulfatase I/J
MVNLLDDMVGNVTAALKAAGLWDNLLWVGSSDNGGPVDPGWGGNNFPLRGGKASNLEGGIRVNAFATGGFIPPALRGTVEEGLIAIEDWYTTFCALAGVDPTDSEAAAAGLPPVEGLDMSGLLTGSNRTSPRMELIIGSSNGKSIQEGNTTVQGVTRADGWKLLIGGLGSAFWQGPIYPNSSGYGKGSLECGDPALLPSAPGHGLGCLFNVFTDPYELQDLAADHPDIVSALRARIAYYAAGVYSPNRGGDDGLACTVALQQHGGFWGPFLD